MVPEDVLALGYLRSFHFPYLHDVLDADFTEVKPNDEIRGKRRPARQWISNPHCQNLIPYKKLAEVYYSQVRDGLKNLISSTADLSKKIFESQDRPYAAQQLDIDRRRKDIEFEYKDRIAAINNMQTTAAQKEKQSKNQKECFKEKRRAFGHNRAEVVRNKCQNICNRLFHTERKIWQKIMYECVRMLLYGGDIVSLSGNSQREKVLSLSKNLKGKKQNRQNEKNNDENGDERSNKTFVSAKNAREEALQRTEKYRKNRCQNEHVGKGFENKKYENTERHEKCGKEKKFQFFAFHVFSLAYLDEVLITLKPCGKTA